MTFNCGIVGLPNVGKSTIFNALTRTQAAQAANFPFCTIDPNTGMVAVPDPRMQKLQQIVKTQRVIPVQIELVDIAGLVKGASAGAGKGNAFLANVRGVDAILHVVRCFEDDDIIHVDGSIDPVRDIEVIDLELILKDEETVKARHDKLVRRKTDKAALEQAAVLEKILAAFAEARPARAVELTPEEEELVAELQLITRKPMLFVCNVAEEDIAAGGNAYSAAVFAHAEATGAKAITLCGKIEEELCQLDDEEAAMFMAEYGMEESGLAKLIRAGYELLGLATYFTAGEKEVRAWQIEKGWKAPRAAGVIHTDFEKGFIRAEVASYQDFVALGGEKACRDAGKLRVEGKDYVVKDGDVVHFLFNT
jgi:GTP-binding protein YchF